MSNNQALLQVENLTKKINNQLIVNGLSFNIKQNEIVSIIGHSGAGKSTLLRILNGLSDFNDGQIIIDNHVIDYSLNSDIKNLHKKIGLVFQNFNLFPHLSVLENMTKSQLLNNKRNKSNILKNARKWLNILHLNDKEMFYPHQLSGGEKQRVAIARALMLKPNILCFDEPTSALDPHLSNEIARVIKRLKEENISILIVTHDMDFAKLVSDKILKMEQGKLIYNLNSTDFFNKKAVK